MITAKKLPKFIREELEFTFPKEDWDKNETAIRVARLFDLPLDETIAIFRKLINNIYKKRPRKGRFFNS